MRFMYVAFPIAVVGLLLYVFSPHAKAAEVGRLLFFIGVLWLVYGVSQKQIHF